MKEGEPRPVVSVNLEFFSASLCPEQNRADGVHERMQLSTNQEDASGMQ
jgi:hypothetical protein